MTSVQFCIFTVFSLAICSLLPESARAGPASREEEVAFANGEVWLAGTLLLPQADKPVPAVVFVHGAAYHDRRDNREEAEYFARRGIAALVYDKRGCGTSSGDWATASQFELAEDALAAVLLLKKRPEIDARRIGLWGMSQGAGVIPLAALRSQDVAFLIPVSGCLSFDRQMYYYRANLFRQRGLPDRLLDIANKASLLSNDFARRVRNGLPVPAAWRARSAFDTDLDYSSEWARVRQPVLAVYGALDRAVPVAQSAAELRQALLLGDNQDWTIVIYPGAGHSLGTTDTGELYEPWRGYVPGFLDAVTDWVLRRSSGGTSSGDGLKGTAQEPALPYAVTQYERLSWYGNSLVQLPLVLVYWLLFAAGCLSWPAGFLFRRLRLAGSRRPPQIVSGLARALCALNLPPDRASRPRPGGQRPDSARLPAGAAPPAPGRWSIRSANRPVCGSRGTGLARRGSGAGNVVGSPRSSRGVLPSLSSLLGSRRHTILSSDAAASRRNGGVRGHRPPGMGIARAVFALSPMQAIGE